MADPTIRIEFDEENRVAVWRLDDPSGPHNTLSIRTLDDIERALDETAERDARAAVIISGKPNSFIVGADIRMLRDVESAPEAASISHRGHELLGRVREAVIPFVAAIHGPALGGGLELALACSYRIATDHHATRFGLPEVNLGLLPGGGGTQLLPRLIGLQKSLELMLTGKNTYPKPALRMGLVDALIHKPGLLRAAKEAAKTLAGDDGGGYDANATRASWQTRAMEATRVIREIIYKKAAESADTRTRGNYPAPRKIIDCVRTGLEDGLEEGLRQEERSFGDLAVSPQSRELVRLFFAKNEAENNPLSDQVHAVKTVGVLGAGLMGSGIAQVSAEAGFEVIVKDRSLGLAAQPKKQVFEEAGRKVNKGAMSSFERDVLVERVVPVDDYALLDDIELIIEAAPEDLSLKHGLIRDVEEVAPESCIFASNTSSIPIEALAAASNRPEQVIGMHYFSPVPKVPLLEIVRTKATPDWVLSTAIDVGLKQGKTVIVVNDGPGFYTTRILALYMNEALDVLVDGGRIDAVDNAMKDFGFPMGPFELFDLVGLDVAAKITEVLTKYFEDRQIAPNERTSEMAEAGLKGRKSSRGFYTYDGEKDEVNDAAYAYFDRDSGGRRDMDRSAIQERLSLVMVNEAARCLDEGILQSSQDGDVGAVFGLGFPPFRGGPFRYAKAIGIREIHRRLESLRERHGSQFTPAASLTP